MPAFVRYWSNNGHWPTLALSGLSANDPKRTIQSHHEMSAFGAGLRTGPSLLGDWLSLEPLNCQFARGRRKRMTLPFPVKSAGSGMR